MIETAFSLGNTTLSALDNQGSGRVIIGLHGFLDNAASLAPLAPYLRDSRFIAVDLPGHGRSFHRPHGAHYHQMDYLQDIYTFIQKQGFEHVIMLGHSLGGVLATLYAAVFPEQVTGVVSIDACGPLTMAESSSAEQINASIRSRYKKVRNKLQVVNLNDAVKARCAITDIQAEHARLIIERNLTQDASGHCFWASDPKLRTRSTLRLTEAQAEALMRNINCPVWIGAASKSFKEINALYKNRKTWFSNSQRHTFEGGHHIHMEKTDEVGSSIRQFVEQL